VLLAAMSAATLIAVTLVALFGGFSGGGDDDQAGSLGGADATPAADAGRRVLSVSFGGSGDGEIQITPGDLSCRRSCDHTFVPGTRVTVTADAASGSTFAGWGDGCDGSASSCTIVLDGERSLSATFDTEPTPAEPAEPSCDSGAAEDPACSDADLDAPPDEDLDAPLPTADCADGRDNDRDGLTDAAQDPDCSDGGAEAGSAAPSGATAPPPPPPRPANDCADGRDNDRDGLTDRAQDPDCAGGTTETG
jgi:hypothetical protein